MRVKVTLTAIIYCDTVEEIGEEQFMNECKQEALDDPACMADSAREVFVTVWRVPEQDLEQAPELPLEDT